MTLEDAIIAHLTKSPSVSVAAAPIIAAAEALAVLVGRRVFPKRMPQVPTYPCIVFHRVAGRPEHSMSGNSEMVEAVLQFDVHAGTAAQARATARSLRLALDSFKGTMGGAVDVGVEVFGAFLQDERDGEDDDLKSFWIQQDFMIQHHEPSS